MIKRTIRGCLLMLCLAVPWGVLAEAADPVVNPAALAGLELRFAGNEQQRAYLGIGSETKLSLAEIKADRLIIAVLNSFCAICQEDAPILNVMYELIEEQASLKGRTKIVGIAPGNTHMEVEQFQTKYQVPFPIFADADFSIDRAIPENMRTPMLITVKNLNGKSPEVVKWHLGRIENPEDVIAETLPSAMVDGAQRVAKKNE